MIANTKPLFIGAALLLSGGLANAGDPLVLTSDQLDNVTAGGGVNFRSNIFDSVRIDKRILQNKIARYDVRTFVQNNAATAEATADAFGSNTDAETFTFAQTTPTRSEAASISVALTQ